MMVKKIVLVTVQTARELDEDLLPLQRALRIVGLTVSIANWDDKNVDWSCFDLVLLRSPWDYTRRYHEFLTWAEQVAKITRLLNPIDVVRWNTDKHYLNDLAKLGIPTVPSVFFEPGNELTHWPDYEEFVVKPCIGAGSTDTQRYVQSEQQAALAHARRLLNLERSVLIQPYQQRVDEVGETSLIFFAGRFSHAIRKGPLLKRGEAATRALFAAEHITPRQPTVDEMEVAEKTLAAIPFTTPLLYARVDLLRDQDNNPRLLELELTEPSLFFAHGLGSVDRFATIIVNLLKNYAGSSSSLAI